MYRVHLPSSPLSSATSSSSSTSSSSATVNVHLDLLIAPLTDLNYKHMADSAFAAPAAANGANGLPDTSSSSAAMTRAERVAASCHAVSMLLRAWPGIVHFCRGGGDAAGDGGGGGAVSTAVKSLIGVLHAPNREMTKSVVSIIYSFVRRKLFHEYLIT